MPPPDTPRNNASTAADVAAAFCATLVDEWLEAGVRHAVVAPGSRSTPMALAIAARPELQLHLFHDERAASFAALGIGLLGMPAILLCTSGTAAAHFHAAVVEAHQSAVPLLVCTADRPPELRDVGAAQTIDQTKLYGDAVRWFHDPGVADEAAAHTWRSLSAHALATSIGAWPGPVHLNLPFREPLVGTAGRLPGRSPGARPIPQLITVPDAALEDLAGSVAGARGVIVAGRGCGSAESVRALALASGWPVLADARSGLRHCSDVAVAAADLLLRSPTFADGHRLEVIIRLGEGPASKVLNQWLASCRAVGVHISAVPAWTDPDGVVGQHVVADPTDTTRRLAKLMTVHDAAWLAGWLAAEADAQAGIDAVLDAEPGLSEPAVARAIGRLVPPGSHLVVSSSMPIRDVEWYGQIPSGVTVHSNRGANGIDGVIATAIGVALATAAPTVLLIGDVALLHDSSALVALARRDIDLRIVVVDNDGGGIFSFLPQATSLAVDRFEQLFGTPHGTDLVALAAAHGLPAITVSTVDALASAVAEPGPSVVRVPSDRAANVAVHQRLNAVATGG